MNADFWKGNSVLVTGATGQIGGWLVKRLLECEAEVVCLLFDWLPQCDLIRSGLIERINVVYGDIRDLDLLRQTLDDNAVVTVFHLAAQSIVSVANIEPTITLDTNIRGTWTLLEACRRNTTVKQIIVASTDKVYGDSNLLPYNEELPLLAVYPHDVSKACAEMIAISYAKTYGLNIATTRLPNIYGGGDLNWNRIIPGTIRSIVNGEQPVINSNGKYIRDYLYVEDAIAAHMLLAEKMAENPEMGFQAFNISSETYLTVLELVETILTMMGSSLQPVICDQTKNEIMNQYLNAGKARNVLGWQPNFTLEEGLKRTIDWYKAFLGEQF
jgi:CDP-glucose 4,6-dehydratase